MAWIVERWRTLQEAFGLWRLVAGISISTISGALTEFIQWLAGRYEVDAVAELPTWAISISVTVVVALACGLFFLLNYANGLRRSLEPSIELRFGPTDKFITNVPYKSNSSEGTARFIRVEAINRSARTALDCSAYLLAVKRLEPNGQLLDTEFSEPMRLSWSFEDNATIRLDSEIHRFFNVLFVAGQRNDIQFSFAENRYPLRFQNLCSPPGQYRMRVCVRGRDVQSETLAIDLDWTGRMETTTARVSQWRAGNT